MIAWLWMAPALALPPAPKMALSLNVAEDPSGVLCYPSGLQVRVAQRAGTGLASVSMVLEGGTSLEDASTRSAAHMVEHLWFQSSPGGEGSVWSQEPGVAFDATTRTDVTTFTTVGPSADLGQLLSLEAARLTDPLQGITEATLTREKRVVAAELGLRGEHTRHLALQQLNALLFPEAHPYHQTIGTSDDVANLSVDALRAYAARAYTPAGASLSIVADLPLEAQQSLVEEAFGELLAGAGATCERPAQADLPDSFDTTPREVNGGVWQAWVYGGFALPPGWSGQDAVARAAMTHLEGEIRSRLAYTRGLTGDAQAAVGCSYHPGRVASAGMCAVIVPDGVNPDDVSGAMLKSLAGQRSTSGDDMRRRTSQVAFTTAAAFREVLRSSDSWEPDDLGDLAVAHHRGEGAPTIQAIDEIFGINEESVRTYATKWLTEERLVRLVLLPGGGGTTTAEPVPAVTALPTPVATDWAVGGASPRVTTTTLKNGLELWAAEHSGGMGVTTAVVSPGGWGRGPMAAAELWDMLARYASPLSFYDLSTQLGMRTWTDVSASHAVTANRGAWANLDMSMWLQRTLLDAAVIEASERQGPIDDALSWSVELPRWPSLHVQRVHRRHLFGDHRLSSTWWDRLAAGRKAKPGDIIGWNRATQRPEHARLVAVGADSAAMAGEAERYLGSWKAKGSKTTDPVPAPPPAPSERSVTAMTWNSQFADVSVQCRLSGADQAQSEVLREVVDMALWDVLREGAGAYAPSTEVRHYGAASVLSLHSALHPGQGPSGLEAMFSLLKLTAAGPPEALVQAARQRVVASWARDVQGSDGHFRRLTQAAARGDDAASVADFAERVAQVSAADVAALLGDCAGQESAVVVSPQAKEVPGATAYDHRAEGKAWSEQLLR